MKKYFIILLTSVVLLLVVMTLSCSKKQNKKDGDSDGLSIGAVYLDTQGYYAGVRMGIQTRANELGQTINVIETNARGDVSKESSFINTLSVAGIDALILSAVSTDGSVRAVRKANEAGIPVICYNTCVNEQAIEENIFAYAVGDPYNFGYLIGLEVGKYIKQASIEEPKIGIINCEQYEVCITRREGFEAALEVADISNWSVVSNQEGTDIDKAISVTEQMLAANQDINILWGESGGASLGAARAVRKLGYIEKVVVFASDMTAEIADELKKYDIIKGVVDISGKKMGALTMDLAMKSINNENLDDKIVQAPIDLYVSQEDAVQWIATHPDGLP